MSPRSTPGQPTSEPESGLGLRRSNGVWYQILLAGGFGCFEHYAVSVTTWC